ncbi:MAG: TlpA family protein disulfide reductase [Dehalococcoidales bacterium]|nr:TlpA family protein disulfide reductase [Dehalococcoidales bacterium]
MTGKWVVLLLAGLLLCFTLLAACSEAESPSGTPSAPSAPDFQLKDLEGQSVSLDSLRGRTVFINFWTTTCPPCINEMPHIQELYQDWSGREDVSILTINMGESAGTVRDFIKTSGYTFPVLLDSRLSVSSKYGVQYTPTSLVVDAQGLLQYRVIGPFRNKESIIKIMQNFMPGG